MAYPVTMVATIHVYANKLIIINGWILYLWSDYIQMDANEFGHIHVCAPIENDGRAWIYWHEVIKHLASESVGVLLIIDIKISIWLSSSYC